MSTRATSRLRTPPGSAYSAGVGVAVACAFLLGLELWLRLHGVLPTVDDDEQLWAIHRARASGSGPGIVITVGASRSQLAFSSEAFKARYPDTPLIRLEVDGSHPLPTFLNLARSNDVGGTMIVSLRPGHLVTDTAEPVGGIRAWEDPYDIGREVERRIIAFAQERVVVASLKTNATSTPLLSLVVEPEAHLPSHRQLPDRSIRADFARVDVGRAREMREAQWQIGQPMFVDHDERARRWNDSVDEIAQAVARVRARGGTVVFVAYPICGPLRSAEDERFPRVTYWDDFASRVGAPTVHYADVPGMTDFDCPDWSHLDMRDAPAFTDLLLDELERQGVLPPP